MDRKPFPDYYDRLYGGIKPYVFGAARRLLPQLPGSTIDLAIPMPYDQTLLDQLGITVNGVLNPMRKTTAQWHAWLEAAVAESRERRGGVDRHATPETLAAWRESEAARLEDALEAKRAVWAQNSTIVRRVSPGTGLDLCLDEAEG